MMGSTHAILLVREDICGICSYIFVYLYIQMFGCDFVRTSQAGRPENYILREEQTMHIHSVASNALHTGTAVPEGTHPDRHRYPYEHVFDHFQAPYNDREHSHCK